jgi:hypothetical protein
MAPLPDSVSIRGYLTTLIKRTPAPVPASSPSFSAFHDLSPRAAALAARVQNILPRATLTDPGAGVTPPQKIPNKAIFALFGLIGVAFVLTGIWFFFWAKNGGFYFHQNDWDDYKSTVLRRKGPNGTTLSGATATTDLGGGSVVHGEKNGRWRRHKRGKGSRYKDFEDEESTLAGSQGGSALGSEMSEANRHANAHGKKKHKKGKSKKSRSVATTELESRLSDEEVDPHVDDAIRAYRHEKPARVGGINKDPDGSAFDGSNADNSTAASELLSNRERTPTNTPTKIRKEKKDKHATGSSGIRKVVSTSNTGSSSFWNRGLTSNRKTPDEEQELIRAEARRLQEKGRSVRRDFSFRAGDDAFSAVTPSSVAPSTVSGEDEERRARREARREAREARRASQSPKKLPGTYQEGSVMGSDMSSDIGTKTYHHPIPGLSSSNGGSDYAEERRKKRNGGYRREV